MDKSLKVKATRGSLAVVGASFGVRVVGIGVMVWLARLLDPADFGVIALAMVVISTAKLISELGLGAAVTQHAQDRQSVAFHAFVTATGAGIVAFFLLFLGAQPIAYLLGSSEYISILRFVSIVLVLDALFVIPRALLIKDMKWGRCSIVSVLSECIYLAVALGLAVLEFGVWSLAWAHVIKSGCNLLFYWALSPTWEWLKPVKWDFGLIRRLLRFGIQVTLGGGFAFFNSVWDDLLIGHTLGSAALGFYNRAYSFANATVTNFTRVFANVLFPSYSQIQHDKARLSAAYLKSFRFISLITIPAAVAIFILSPTMVPTLFGDKWIPMVPILQVLVFMGMVRTLSGTTSPIFLSVGHPEFNTRVSLVHALVMVPLAFLLLHLGPLGVATAVTVAYTLGLCYNIYQIQKIIPKAASKMIPALYPSVGGSLCMAVSIWCTQAIYYHLQTTQTAFSLFIIPACVGALIYLIFLIFAQRNLVKELVGLGIKTLGLDTLWLRFQSAKQTASE